MKPQPILLIFHLLRLLQVSLSQNACSQLPGVLHAHVSEQSRKDVYQLGETILYTCDTGFTSDLPIKYVCSSEGWVTLRQESCYSSTATCERPSTCGGLRITGLPENNSPIPPGHVLIFGCDDPKKRLKGSSVLICDNDGQWNKPVPSCEGLPCDVPQLGPSPGLSPITLRVKSGGKLNVFCNSEYELEGANEIECLDTGLWSSTFPTCTSLPCNVPQLGPGLSTSPIIPRVKSGGKLNVFCNSGYELEGANEIECLDTGLWSSTFPTCTKTCEMPDIPTILRLMTPVEGTRAKKGQKLEFECSQRGKFIQGNAEIECLESGEWSDQLPRCGDRRTCSAPPAIEFGDVMGSRTEYQEGESAEYTCPRYYLMEGGPWRTCRSGQWTGRVRCIKPCSVTKEEMDKHHLQLQKHWLDKIYSEHNDHLTFICKEGKRPDGRVGMRQQCVEGVIELPTCV